jgi:hypothetical protein
VELLALLVRHQFVGELVLEGGEAPECGATALGAEDAHCEDVLADLAPDLVVGAAAGLGAVVHAVDALAGAARHEVDIWGYALYASAVGAVKLEGTLGAALFVLSFALPRPCTARTFALKKRGPGEMCLQSHRPVNGGAD